MLIALLADLIAVNRRLSEETLIRLKKLEMPEARKMRMPRERFDQRPQRRDRERPAGAPPAPAAQQRTSTQWVWLLDEDKLGEREMAPVEPEAAAVPEAPRAEGTSSRRRRRRRGGVRHHAELPGNRGKHLVDNTDE